MNESLKIVAESSGTMITWSLSILGGTILSILSTSYLKPLAESRFRWVYLLFLPGWFFIGRSILFGTKISRSIIAYHFVKKADVKDRILDNINGYFDSQLFSMNMGLVIFGGWLTAFVLIWIFTKHFEPSDKQL